MDVADPFLYVEDGTYYIFFEEIGAPNATIGVATSTDKINWVNGGTVLDETFHLSFPYVFKYEELYYMIPDVADNITETGIRVYTTTSGNFPNGWTHNTTIMNSTSIGQTGNLLNMDDPVTFRWNNEWWIIYNGNDTDLQAGVGTDLLDFSTWNFSLPINPIFDKAGNDRPGGRALVWDNSVTVFLQDITQVNLKVRSYDITTLNRTAFDMHEIPGGPITQGTTGWTSNGTHQVDCWWEDYQDPSGANQWICVIDGRNATHDYSIGLFVSNNSAIEQRLPFNENNGTVVHDTSGNSNNGIIDGATWTTDGALKTLVATFDYTLSTTTGLFTITNNDYSWAELLTTWSYTVTSDAGGAADSMIDQFANYPALIGLVGTIVFLGLVIGILVVSFVFGGKKDTP